MRNTSEHIVQPIPGLPHYRFLDELAALPFVEAIYLYGSRAKGDADEWSDVDLALDCPHMKREEWYAVEDILEKANILVDVECKRLQDIPESLFKSQVEKYKKLLYAKH